ncbi:MAG: GNAT family N-acetyltransferase [Candidatus Bathyarchaeia archaeon]
MSPEQYGFAVDLANTMDWGMETADFRFNQSLEPEGCLILFNETEPVGIATCISFGKVGWFGNLIVKKEQRKHGAGRLLLEHAINYLKGKGVQTIGLYGYQHLKEFYGKSGFKSDINLTVMQNYNMQHCDWSSDRFETEPDFSALSRFDSNFFGADRSRLLKSIMQKEMNLCYASVDGKEVEGYILSKNYETMAEVGPLVCDPKKPMVALDLLKAMLAGLKGKRVALYLPQNQKGVEEFLVDSGFKKEFSLSRMFLGMPKIQNSIHLAESLERG